MASRLQDVHLRTTTALKPLATAVAEGTIHFDTDTGALTRSNKIVWETYSGAGGGTGDVVGPAVAVDSDIALFDGITGKLLKDSGMTLAALLAAAGGFQLIEEQNPTAVNAFTFAAIPAGFVNLEIRYSGRSSQAATQTDMFMRFNGDVGANYDTQFLNANLGGLAAGMIPAQTNMIVGTLAGATAPAGSLGVGIMSILNYLSSTLNKQGTNQTSRIVSNTDMHYTSWGLRWRGTAPITSITFTLAAAANFVDAKFSLYGLK